MNDGDCVVVICGGCSGLCCVSVFVEPLLVFCGVYLDFSAPTLIPRFGYDFI